MNKMHVTVISILMILGLTISACAANITQSNLGGTSWVLVSYGKAGEQTPSAADIHTSLIFALDGQVSGNLGCNGFSGKYELNGDKLVFDPMASTLMACPEAQMTQEGIAFQVMTGTAQFVVEGNSLKIYDASGTISITLARVGNQ
jgi:heat shock protein HslJ